MARRLSCRVVVAGYVRSLFDDVSMNARIEQVSSDVKVERAWLCGYWSVNSDSYIIYI